jgi:phosphoribosylformylglycinamidine synthase
VGIVREQGSNGDREMAAAFASAGFEAWDVTVHDLVRGAVSLAEMDGLAFVGGFSYGDALGSGAWLGGLGAGVVGVGAG